MWFSFWRSRNRFSLDELRYLTDQLQKVQVINEVNKDFVIEALRSIAELVTYGDQNDASFFEFFMEKQIMGEFARILSISKPAKVVLQLLQTMSIMIQNLRSDHAIYYIFSNEHTNYFITYSFDFQNDELLSYYISFLRAISGKLNKSTISLLVKTINDEVISFPLYVEAIRFAFHEENMVRIAVRALTLNVYHVGDENINKYVAHSPQSDYFSNMIKYFRKQCLNLDEMVAQATRNPDSADSSSSLLSAVDEIEDNLYYYSDIISSGVPDLGKVITDYLLEILIFPFLLPSLRKPPAPVTVKGARISITTALFLLCCVLHIFKNKDLASIVAAALFFPQEAFAMCSEATPNGHGPGERLSHHATEQSDSSLEANTVESGSSLSSTVSIQRCNSSSQNGIFGSHTTLRKTLLSNIVHGDDSHVFGSLSLLATLLQTKELDESMLDALGILPQRKQHKKLLLQALVGEDTSEEQLYFSSNSMMKDNAKTELDRYLLKLKDDYKVPSHLEEEELSARSNRDQVLDALVSLLCRSDLPAGILWLGGWLIRQLLPHVENELSTLHLKLLKDSHEFTISRLLEEIRGTWCDVLIDVLKEEWRIFRRAFEASSPPKDPKSVLLLSKPSYGEGESSFAAVERMCETVKVFVLQHQLLLFSFGGTVPDMLPLSSSKDSSVYSPTKTSDLLTKPGSEVSLENALPCKIAFERGKERHFWFLAMSQGTSGWIILAEQSPVKQQYGVVRVTAPLAGSDPRIDEKHPKWLHLRIRPLVLPFLDQAKYDIISKGKMKVVVDGRWTLAFRDEQACKAAELMMRDDMNRQQSEVEKLLKPLLSADDTSGFASRVDTSTEEQSSGVG